mmetsp:Transcript_39006/g.79730  ORF Transcript_39006/g.79730 Transcript_39006/m.79730 type:complete len:288 (+) Transcript_39006:198-1061(+)
MTATSVMLYRVAACRSFSVSLCSPIEHYITGNGPVIAASCSWPDLRLDNRLTHRNWCLLEIDVVQTHGVVVDRGRIGVSWVKFRPGIGESHWNLPTATEGIHLAKPEELLRGLVVARVQISHEDNGVWVLPLDATQGSNDKVNRFHHNVVPLAAQWVCTCSNQCISIRLAAQRSPIHRPASREWNQITGDVLPLVSTEEDVSIVELLRGSTSGKCVDISGDLVQAIQDGMLLMPHLWDGRNLWLHAHELVHHRMNAARQREDVEVPRHEARGVPRRRLRDLPLRRLR